jgi:hypothetical protein
MVGLKNEDIAACQSGWRNLTSFFEEQLKMNLTKITGDSVQSVD